MTKLEELKVEYADLMINYELIQHKIVECKKALGEELKAQYEESRKPAGKEGNV